MRIAITGADGFIGRALVRHASDSGLSVRALVRERRTDFPYEMKVVETGNLERSLDPARFFDGCSIAVNLAARVHVTREGPRDPEAAYFSANADMPVALAVAAARAGVRRFVQLSSVAALCSLTPPGLCVGDDFPPAPDNAYGRSKLAGDRGLAQLQTEIGISVVSLRPPTVFGPGVAAYFRQLMRCAKAGLPLPLGGIANQRSFMFLENLADAILAAAHSSESGSFIVTDSPPVSTAEIYRKLLRLYGRPGWVPAVPSTLVKPLARMSLGARADSLLADSSFDGSRFANLFKWFAPVAFDQALALTVGERG
jgi:nucleoside-diphosphate-sugar epimerase